MREVIAEGGIHCCIDKPWNDDDLLKRVRSALDMRPCR